MLITDLSAGEDSRIQTDTASPPAGGDDTPRCSTGTSYRVACVSTLGEPCTDTHLPCPVTPGPPSP